MLHLTEEEYQKLTNERKPKSKYHAQKIQTDGIKFDSKKEARRYHELKLLEKVGEITELTLQPTFELIPTQRDKDGKILERKCSYRGDFSYKDKEGNLVVEDVKSPATSTPLYRMKRKLMLYQHGIIVQEV